MQKVDFCNRGRRQTFDGADSDALKDSGSHQRGKARRGCTPSGCTNEENAADEVYGPFSVKNGRRRRKNRSHTHAHHEQARCQGHTGDGDIIVVGDIGKAGCQNGCHATSHHAVNAQRQQGGIASPLGPVQGVVGGVFGLGIQNNLSVGCHLLVISAWPSILVGPVWLWRSIASGGNGRMRCPCRSVAQTQRLVAILGKEQHGPCSSVSGLSARRHIRAKGMRNLPGTSTVSASFRTPKLHLGAFEDGTSSSDSDGFWSLDVVPKNGSLEKTDRLLAVFSSDMAMLGPSSTFFQPGTQTEKRQRGRRRKKEKKETTTTTTTTTGREKKT